MSKWKCGICNSEFDNYQAQGFNGIIYCPLCYFKELYKREKTKNDKAIEMLQNSIFYSARSNSKTLYSQVIDKLIEILKGEDNE